MLLHALLLLTLPVVKAPIVPIAPPLLLLLVFNVPACWDEMTPPLFPLVPVTTPLVAPLLLLLVLLLLLLLVVFCKADIFAGRLPGGIIKRGRFSGGTSRGVGPTGKPAAVEA